MPGLQFFYGAKPIQLGRPLWTAPALPELIGEHGDVLLFNFMSDYVGAKVGSGLLMFLLRVQVSLVGVLMVMSGALMSRQVIFFSVVLGTGTMGVSSKVTVFGSYLL